MRVGVWYVLLGFEVQGESYNSNSNSANLSSQLCVFEQLNISASKIISQAIDGDAFTSLDSRDDEMSDDEMSISNGGWLVDVNSHFDSI